MSLAEQLDAIRAASAKKMPQEVRAVMGRATDDLRQSGILDRVLGVGDTLPEFALRNAQGAEIRSADLLARGGVVLTVFRGSW